MDKYEKEEFLTDADMEFYKVKKLLDKNPKVLRDDPILSLDYHKIITLIRQKKLVEKTSDHFDSANAYKHTWQDVDNIKRDKLAGDVERLKRYQESLRASGEFVSGGDVGELRITEDESANTVRQTKKQELKQRRDIITQFDKIATSFQSSKKSTVGKDHQITARDGTEMAETAGMIKKRARDKKKKEKTLGAKLRLKTKKGGDGK